MDSTFWAARSPRRMIAPRPNCFSIWRMAASTARPRSPFFSTGTWAVATGASICRFAPDQSYGSRRRWGSLLVAGIALLAPWLDDLDRCRRLVRGRRRELRCLLLGLALRLLARSISALCHRSNLLLRAGQAAPSCAAGPYQPLTRRLPHRSARFYASLRDSSAVASRHSTPASYDVIRCRGQSPRQGAH